MRNLRSLLLLALFVISPLALAETVGKMPAPTGYIDDYAGVLTSPVQSQMESLCKELHDKTKAQVFVVTINTLDNKSIEQFSNELFHNWKIGEKKTDRGVLLLFAIKDHKYRIEVGSGLEGILNDAKVGDFGRAMVPDLRANNYDAAITSGLDSVVKVIADDSKVELDDALTMPAPLAAPPEQQAIANNFPPDVSPIWVPFVVGGGFLLFIGTFIFLAIKGRRSSGGSSSGWSSGDSSSSSSDDSSSDSFSGGDGGDSDGGGASGSW